MVKQVQGALDSCDITHNSMHSTDQGEMARRISLTITRILPFFKLSGES